MTGGHVRGAPRATKRGVAPGSVVAIAVSMLVHVGVLVLVGGWLDQRPARFPHRALAVAIWTEPEPPVPPEVPADDVSARTVDVAEPAPAEVEADDPLPLEESVPMESDTETPAPEPEPEPVEAHDEGIAQEVTTRETEPEPIVIPEPPPEPARPELPEIGTPALEVEPPISPLSGVLVVPPAGPADVDRGRIIGERLSASARRAAERSARLEGQGRSRAVAGLEREADTLMVPVGDTPLASEKGVLGPLGKRHILYSEPPEYPAWARRQGLEAQVRFKIWVTPEGDVGRVEVLERSGSTDLDRLAEEALRKWRFQPMPRNATARDEWGEVPMSFTLVADPGD